MTPPPLVLSKQTKEESFVSEFSPVRLYSNRYNNCFMADLDNIQNLGGSFDPFADAAKEEAASAPKDIVHIRVQQRNGRKCLTTVQGINPKIDLKKVIKAFKKEFACNGTVIEDEEFGKVIQLQGDQRTNASTFLTKQGICAKDAVKVHGF